MSASRHAYRARGCAARAVTAGLTVAAHGLAGGGYPSGTAFTLLVAACIMIGVAAASVRIPVAIAVLGLLGFGQFAGPFRPLDDDGREPYARQFTAQRMVHVCGAHGSHCSVRDSYRRCRAAECCRGVEHRAALRRRTSCHGGRNRRSLAGGIGLALGALGAALGIGSLSRRRQS